MEQKDYLYSLSSQGKFEELVKHVRYNDNKDVRYGASGVISESVNAFQQNVTEEQKSELLEAILREPSDSVRANVLDILIQIEDESILENIITRLDSNTEPTPTDTPYPLILTKWHSSQHPELRLLAVVGFGNLQSETSRTRLRTTISKEQNLKVLRRAIEESGKIGDETFVTPIQNYIHMDNEEYQQSSKTKQINKIKKTAVNALINIGTDAAYEALLSAVRGREEEIKEHVIEEIGRFGAEQSIDVIVDELDNENPDIKESAAEGIMTTFEEAESHSIREEVLKELGDQVESDVSETFSTIVSESPNYTEKRNAAWLLGELDIKKGEESIEALIQAINDDDDEYLKKISTATLDKIEDKSKIEKLRRFKKDLDENTEAYELAEFLLRENSAEEAKKELINYTYVEDPSDYGSEN